MVASNSFEVGLPDYVDFFLAIVERVHWTRIGSKLSILVTIVVSPPHSNRIGCSRRS